MNDNSNTRTFSIKPTDNPYRTTIYQEKWPDIQESSSSSQSSKKEYSYSETSSYNPPNNVNDEPRISDSSGDDDLLPSEDDSEFYQCNKQYCCPSDFENMSALQSIFYFFVNLGIFASSFLIIAIESKYLSTVMILRNIDAHDQRDTSTVCIAFSIFSIFTIFFRYFAIRWNNSCCKSFMKFIGFISLTVLIFCYISNTINLNPIKCDTYINMYMIDFVENFNSTDSKDGVAIFKKYYDISSVYQLYDYVNDYVYHSCGADTKLRLISLGLLFPAAYSFVFWPIASFFFTIC